MQDHELIKRIRQGEQTLFGELAGRYYNDIFRYCYYQTGDEQAAWDCTQETFYRLMRFLDAYTEKGRFKAYLLRIALNACRDWFRRENGREVLLDENDDGSDTALLLQDAQNVEKQVENSLLIRGALARLPEFQREAVVLYYYYGYKQREIAHITGVPLSTVKTRLRAGTERLQILLKNDYTAPHESNSLTGSGSRENISAREKRRRQEPI